MLCPRRSNVHGSFAAVRRGMGKVDQNSSYLMGRRTFLPSGFAWVFFPHVFSPLVKDEIEVRWRKGQLMKSAHRKGEIYCK